MSFLRAMRKLVLGETWLLPLGVLLTLGVAALLREVAPEVWHDAGPVLLPLAILIVLALGVQRSLPPPRSR